MKFITVHDLRTTPGLVWKALPAEQENPDGGAFYDVAIAGKADHLITGNAGTLQRPPR